MLLARKHHLRGYVVSLALRFLVRVVDRRFKTGDAHAVRLVLRRSEQAHWVVQRVSLVLLSLNFGPDGA